MEIPHIGYLLKIINDKMKAHGDADLKARGLTLTQSRVLAFLYGRDGCATQKEIEVFLAVSHPTVVGVVSRMERNGFLRCRRDPADQRNKLVEMTEKARDLGLEMERSIARHDEQMLRTLSPGQIEAFEQTLLTIYQNLE